MTPPLKIESILLCFQNSKLWEAVSYSIFAVIAAGLETGGHGWRRRRGLEGAEGWEKAIRIVG